MSIKLGLLASSQQQAAPLLLDVYPGASVAYSLRKLRTAYTGNAIRVRRSSDNALLNIPFTSSGNLDTTTLLTFCGVSNGFVDTWYDQSTNGNNATQSTLANQPQIVNSGNIILINTKPSLQIDTTDFFSITDIVVNIRTTFSVIKRLSVSSNFFIYGTNTTGGVSNFHYNNFFYFETDQKYIISNSSDNTINQIILSGYNSNSSTAFQYKNNNLIASTTNNQTRSSYINRIFTYNGSLFSEGYAQEIIIYASNNSSNLSGINTNINSFYSIY